MKKIVYWLLVVLWMLLIFSFSQKEASTSSSESRKIVSKVVYTIEKNKSKQEKERIVDLAHIPFRKFAHGFEYAILCILLLLALKTTNIKINYNYIIALIICIIYACTDEAHQLFITGRSGEFKDVCIDTAGSSIGLILYIIINKLKKSNFDR